MDIWKNEKFWHSRRAYLGYWLYLYLVILEYRLSGTMRTVLAVHTLACVMARARLAHQVPERPLTGWVMPTMKNPSRALRFWQFWEFFLIWERIVLEIAWAVWNSQNGKYWAGFLKCIVLFVLFTNTLQIHVPINMLNLEKEFQGIGERAWIIQFHSGNPVFIMKYLSSSCSVVVFFSLIAIFETVLLWITFQSIFSWLNELPRFRIWILSFFSAHSAPASKPCYQIAIEGLHFLFNKS